MQESQQRPRKRSAQLYCCLRVARKEALQRINSQLSTKEKRKYADYVINTSGPFPQTRKQAVRIYEKLKRLAEK